MEAHCDWSTIVKGKLYWNNISLDPGGTRGTVGPNENYTMYQKVDIWYEAKKTDSCHDGLVNSRSAGGELIWVSRDFYTCDYSEANTRVNCINKNTTSQCSENTDFSRRLDEGTCDIEMDVMKMVF